MAGFCGWLQSIGEKYSVLYMVSCFIFVVYSAQYASKVMVWSCLATGSFSFVQPPTRASIKPRFESTHSNNNNSNNTCIQEYRLMTQFTTLGDVHRTKVDTVQSNNQLKPRCVVFIVDNCARNSHLKYEKCGGVGSTALLNSVYVQKFYLEVEGGINMILLALSYFSGGYIFQKTYHVHRSFASCKSEQFDLFFYIFFSSSHAPI